MELIIRTTILYKQYYIKFNILRYYVLIHFIYNSRRVLIVKGAWLLYGCNPRGELTLL